MTTPAPDVSAMRVVTISREYGSGGGEVAARLAERLGWQLVDHEVVTQIAKRLGVEEEDAAAHDERSEGWVMQFLTTMQTVGPMVAMPSDLIFPPDEAAYARALREVVNGAVQAGQSVIVGRGSQIILHARRDTLHARIVAPLELRIAYVAERENLTRVAAQQRIQQKDADRRRYLLATYRRTPDDAHLYDITLNTAVIDLDSCVELILQALAAKAARLKVPVESLGPLAHLEPYPTTPADFTPTTESLTDGDSEGSAESSADPAEAQAVDTTDAATTSAGSDTAGNEGDAGEASAS